MTRMMSSSNGGEHNKGIFTAPLEIQQELFVLGQATKMGKRSLVQTVMVTIKLEYLNTT